MSYNGTASSTRTVTSLPLRLELRSQGRFTSNDFYTQIASKRRQRSLLHSPQIIVPQQNTKMFTVSALDLSNEARFLLAGRKDGSILVYDLSKWGGERKDDAVQHLPIAQALRPSLDSSPQQQQEQQRGHLGTIQSARWYAVDSGAFVSAATDGKLMVWDTAVMEAVVSYTPFPNIQQEGVLPIHSMDIGRTSHLAAVSSLNDATVRLVDIRSGAASHSLVGHAGGVSTVKWSPASEYVVASGGTDRCVRLWDIRKAGSLSCLTVLNQQDNRNNDKSRRSRAVKLTHYGHLRKRQQKSVAPNDFRHAEQDHAVFSSDKHIFNLAFDATGRYLAVSDGSLSVWDLHYEKKLHHKFVSHHGTANLTTVRSPLSITDDAGEPTIWIGSKSALLGYALTGGKPRQSLVGHISTVTALATVKDTMEMVTAGKDGLILMWGHAKRSASKKRRLTQDTDCW